MSDIQVTDVEVIGVVEKSPRGTFRVPVRYTLVDGATVDTAVSASRKRDVLPAAADLKARAADGKVEACFDDDGAFLCTGVRYGR